jgi:hypothetical protein
MPYNNNAILVRIYTSGAQPHRFHRDPVTRKKNTEAAPVHHKRGHDFETSAT